MAEFVLPERTVTLRLEDTDYAGAEIVVRISMPLRFFFKADAIVAQMRANPRDLEHLEEAIAFFVEHGLVSWNLVDRSGPVPPTAEGMADHLEPGIIGTIIAGWLSAVAQVPGPLASRSPAGATSRARRASRSRRSSARPSSSMSSAAAGPATR